MILGFGAIEEKTAIAIIEECVVAIKNAGKTPKRGLDKIQKKYSDLGDKYKPMKSTEVPERYSYFYHSLYEMYPGNCVVVFSFHHINRRHPFSGDGWALLQTEWVVRVCDIYGTSIYKQVKQL